METEPIPITQLPLFIYGESITNPVELFPAVWKATELLTSPNSGERLRGIDALLEVGAHRVSPLVAYMIATCLKDVDLGIRGKVINSVADLITRIPNKVKPSDEVREVIIHYLHNIQEDTVYGILELSAIDKEADSSIYHLFNACPFAGKYMGEILTQWKHPISIRQKAAYFIGLVGYLEALPVLERLYNRLEARQNGQFSMEFAPPSSKTDENLLPDLLIAIDQLKVR